MPGVAPAQAALSHLSAWPSANAIPADDPNPSPPHPSQFENRLETQRQAAGFPVDDSRYRFTLSLVSKAFTRESDDSGAEEMPFVRRQIPHGTRNLITPQGAAQLRQKLESLAEERRAWTATSDETDNDRRAQRQKLDAMIRHLQEVLVSIVVTEPPVDRSKVGFGASVDVMYPDGHQETFRIVGVDEADPDHGSISWGSPIAKALLSKRAGDPAPFQGEELRVLGVSYG